MSEVRAASAIASLDAVYSQRAADKLFTARTTEHSDSSNIFSALYSRRPVRRGCCREALRRQSGMRRPARCLARNSREAPETGPPPLRADARSSQAVKRTSLHSAPDRSHKSRGGAPRGERPASMPLAQTAQACLRWTQGASQRRLRASVTGPRKGAAAPERLSALRPLTLLVRGKRANLGGF
jgi:hypothetical protein